MRASHATSSTSLSASEIKREVKYKFDAWPICDSLSTPILGPKPGREDIARWWVVLVELIRVRYPLHGLDTRLSILKVAQRNSDVDLGSIVRVERTMNLVEMLPQVQLGGIAFDYCRCTGNVTAWLPAVQPTLYVGVWQVFLLCQNAGLMARDLGDDITAPKVRGEMD